MEENLGTLYFDFRARLAAWKQDLAQMDRDVDSYRKKWEAPMRIGGGGGSGNVHTAPATATMAAVGGGGPNVTGTSNGDVTWNLRQAVRDTGARYGGGRRGGGAGMEDWAPDQRIGDVASDYVQGGRMRMLLGEARFQSDRSAERERQQDLHDEHYGYNGQSRISGVLGEARAQSDRQLREQRNQDAVNESKYQSENSLMGKLSKPVAIRTLLRGTMAGLVIDALAGELGNESNYAKAMQLSGMDSVAQSSATIGRVRGGLSAVPFVGGVLNSLATPFIAPIEMQNELTQRQLSFQDSRFGAGVSAAAAGQRRGAIAAGPNALSSALGNLQAQRTAMVGGFQASNKAQLDEFDKANPSERMVFNPFANPIVDAINGTGQTIYSSQPLTGSELADRNFRRSQLVSSMTGQNNRELAVNDQQRLEAARTGWFNLSMTTAELTRQKTANQFRPIAADAQYGVDQGQAILDEYGNRPNPTATDQRQTAAALGLIGEGFRGKQREVVDNLRWGSAMQYNPMVDSPLSFVDRSVESQSDAIEALTKAIQENTEQIKTLSAGGSNN